jgi:hypothetical protein
MVIDLLTLHARRRDESDRQHTLTERFIAAHPDVPVVAVPALGEDVHDLVGLRGIGERLSHGA